MKTKRQWLPVLGVCLPLVAIALFWFNRMAVLDWAFLQDYAAPTNIQQLASRTTMTNEGKRLFYVNHPQVQDRAAFNKSCTNKTEQSVVLGCYHGNRAGIFLFNVTDSELDGVKEVTAAHEMLHQAYDRLSASERKDINAQLEAFYKNGLTNQSVKDQVALYKQTEPNDVDNEMHSLFGTEVANLPTSLENYYKQYFSKRSAVTDLYSKYQSAFTSRQQQIAADDAQLKDQKQAINSLETSLEQQNKQLEAQRVRMEAYKSAGNYSAYNAQVPSYNAAIDSYNAQVEDYKAKIVAYNQLVDARNSIALQENNLQQELDSHNVTSTQTQ